jgi:hypothetical protein
MVALDAAQSADEPRLRAIVTDGTGYNPVAFGPTSTTTLAAGTRLGPYRIGARIGAGGMVEVYRARDPGQLATTGAPFLVASGAFWPSVSREGRLTFIRQIEFAGRR